MSLPRRIVCAAMLMDDGLIVTGIRHYSPEMRATLRRIYGSGLKVFGVWLKKPYWFRVKAQGFVDTHGTFVPRKEAWLTAEANAQIRPHSSLVRGTLYSEDLY